MLQKRMNTIIAKSFKTISCVFTTMCHSNISVFLPNEMGFNTGSVTVGTNITLLITQEPQNIGIKHGDGLQMTA